jgi:hypothetical protein
MKDMLLILWEVLFPIFSVVIAGYFIQKKFHFHLASFTKLQLYLFLPALIFVNILSSELDRKLILQIVSFTILLFIILMIISTIIAKILKLERKKEKAFMNAIVLRNQGNYGIPLITILYITTGNVFPLSVHMIVLFTTNLLLNTIGLYNASSGTYTQKEALIKILRLPMVYVMILGLIFKNVGLSLPGPIHSSLTILASGVVPLALITLGASLSDANLKLIDKTLPLATFLRLVFSPLLAYILTLIMGISGEIAQVLIIGAAAPTAINSVLLAIEFKGDSEYASETVFITTALSAVTITIVIAIVRQFIPV